MEAYADAADAWQWKVRGIGSIYNREGKLGYELFRKYSFDLAESVKKDGYVETDVAVQFVWINAKDHLRKAESFKE